MITNQTLLDEAREALAKSDSETSDANWTLGRCAAQWNGTDTTFADELRTTRARVSAARRVHERFAELRHRWQLPWTHYFAVVASENATELLTAVAAGKLSLADLRTPRSKSGVQLQNVVNTLNRWAILWPRSDLLSFADALAEVELTVRREIEYRRTLPPPPP